MAKKRKDGRYSLQFTVNGKRHTVYGKTVKECREKELQEREKIAKKQYKTAENITVAAYFERWLDNKAGTVKEATIRANRKVFKAMSEMKIDEAGTQFGQLKLVKVEPQNVRDLQAALLEKRKTRTVNDSISLLKCIFQSAIEERMISWNPVTPIKALKRTEEAARDTIHRALTLQETRQFFEAAADNNSWYYNLYTFLLHTGCRIGEAGALYRSDIEKNGIQISRTITQLETGAHVIGDDTKTAAGKRYIPLDEVARQAVTNQIRLEAAINGQKVIGIKQTVFRSPRGNLLHDNQVNYDITRICKKAGIDRFTVHAFRDTFATRCVESGMDVKLLQEIMGHTDVSMTLGLYAHAMDDRKEEQIKAVNFE